VSIYSKPSQFFASLFSQNLLLVNEPCMLINCPNFNAAPLICDNFDTNRFKFASVIMSEDDCSPCSDELVDRRRTSDAAP